MWLPKTGPAAPQAASQSTFPDAGALRQKSRSGALAAAAIIE